MTTAKQRTLGPCMVCDGKSIGLNFGVATCMACKAFFRRNAVKLGHYEFVCAKDGDCPITHGYRRLCNCCRLAKCFRVGMQRDLILTESEKKARRDTIEQNRQRKLQTSKTSTASESVLPSGSLPVAHKPSACLSTSDRALLATIFDTYESNCIAGRECTGDEFPASSHSSMHTFFRAYYPTHMALIQYLTCIPQLKSLLATNKLSLFRNQFSIINHINVPLVSPQLSNNMTASLQSIFGADLSARLVACIERMQPFLVDSMIVKLLLIVVAFASGICRDRHEQNINQISFETSVAFAAQNVYVDLLWKYILSRSKTELEAIKLFDALVRFLLDLHDVHFLIDDYASSLPIEIEQIEQLIKHMWPRPMPNTNEM